MRRDTFIQDMLQIVFWAVLIVVAAMAWIAFDAYAEIPDSANRYRREYARIVRSEWGLNGPIASLAAQIHQESTWDCRAISRVGARGCAQFMPATAVWIGDVDHALKAGDLHSPAWAFRAQAVYMKWLHARIKASDQCNQMAFALAAYNGGLGYVYRRQKLSRRPGICFAETCDINPGIAPANQVENAHYPRRILRELELRYVSAGWGGGSCS